MKLLQNYQLVWRTWMTACLVLSIASLQAQDTHFSQYYNAPLTISPGQVGAFDADLRFIGNYRNQWYSAQSPFTTFNASFDQKLFNDQMEAGYWSLGGNFSHDYAGDANLSNSSVDLMGTYTKALDKENFLTGGISVGLAHRNFEPTALTFDNQWNGDVFDPNLGINENFVNTSKTFIDFGVGVNWMGVREDKRTTMLAGVALYHVTTPDQSFNDPVKSPLDRRLSLYIAPVIEIADKWDLVLHGTGQVQGGYLEVLAGGAGRVHLNQDRGHELAVQLGFGGRFNAIGDALIPSAELHWKSWVVGLSYDINISDFTVATNSFGGPEIAVRYIIRKVKPMQTFKICKPV